MANAAARPGEGLRRASCCGVSMLSWAHSAAPKWAIEVKDPDVARAFVLPACCELPWLGLTEGQADAPFAPLPVGVMAVSGRDA
jgi:hypothetical protein